MNVLKVLAGWCYEVSWLILRLSPVLMLVYTCPPHPELCSSPESFTDCVTWSANNERSFLNEGKCKKQMRAWRNILFQRNYEKMYLKLFICTNVLLWYPLLHMQEQFIFINIHFKKCFTMKQDLYMNKSISCGRFTTYLKVYSSLQRTIEQCFSNFYSKVPLQV